ncbi:hypothetical protein CVT25_003998 [Psilocybe cyanescens]|uniref:Uncharacterized protein n=1 Tax=Psilocybe cyanescens TaxID=93625 RepID=A0A409WXQ6_PSICY|nr:hypothetical protein CVT25_003998 [Psilocybe cyanescens]
MDFPSTRELELEVLLREKDAQLAEVTDDNRALRQYLSKQPGPSTSDPVTLPPALFSVLLPHITSAAENTIASSSSTVTAALTQRTRLLQEENEELYNLLKQSETGKLKDEVRGLRRVVARLQGALKDSHQTISSLSTELDKAYETLDLSQNARSIKKSKSPSRSPQNSYQAISHAEPTGNGTHSASRPPPTEPRAHKRPRLSESQPSSPPRLAPSLPQKPQTHHHNNNHGSHHLPPRVDGRAEHGRHSADSRSKANTKMEVDDGDAPAPAPPQTNREQPRERNHRERERSHRDRELNVKERERAPREGGKDWDRDGGKNSSANTNLNSNSRRNGHTSGPSGRGAHNGGASGRKGNDRNHSNSTNHAADHGNRTLQERLGL